MEDLIIGLLMEACWEKDVPAGKAWEVRLAFLATCAFEYPHLNYEYQLNHVIYKISG